MSLLKIKREIKNLINYFLDVILVLSIIVTLASSYILWFVIPRGVGVHSEMCGNEGMGFGGNYFTVLGIPRYLWVDIHNWAAVILLGLIMLHIIMHYTWIVKIFKRTKSYFNGPFRKAGEQYISSIVLFILFAVDCFSGFVLWLILPRGALDYFYMLQGSGRTFWGLQRNVWLDIHVWVSVLIVAIVIIHIILNWRWVVRVSKKILNWFTGLFISKSKKESV
ncbi:MAG: DUF4405 domain-containing protein [Dehalococcoidales bacterium]|nr:DUF4405 domain-containing protein [Dehalococcoidales bacterium]